jgi:hypothetical protein
LKVFPLLQLEATRSNGEARLGDGQERQDQAAKRDSSKGLFHVLP